MAYTRAQIRQRIGGVEFCGDMTLSTTTSLGSTSTLADTSLKQADDWWNFGQIVPITSTNAGEVRYVSDWVQSTSTFTVDRVWAAVIASGVTYEVHREFSYPNKNDAINAAIRSGQTRWTQRVEDTSLTLDDQTYTYSLAALTGTLDPVLGIDAVMYDTNTTGTGYPYNVIHPSFYEVRWSGSTPTLQFLIDPPIDNETLRLVYRRRPAQLSSDSDTLTPDDESFYNYVCAKATAILFRERAMREPESDWTSKAERMEALAESFFNLDKPQPKPKPVRSTMLLFGGR